MRCKFCQAEIDNDSVFCPHCGKKQSDFSSRPQSKPNPAPQMGKPKGKDNKKVWWLALMIFLLCIGLYFLFFHSCEGNKKDIDPIEVIDEDKHVAEDDSAFQVKVMMEQQQMQDSLLKVAKAKTDSLEYIKDSLKNVEAIKKDAAKSTTSRQHSSNNRSSSTNVPAKKKNVSLVVGTKNYSYGTFNGTLKNGLPHDVSGRLIFKTVHRIDSRDPKGRVADPGDYVIGEFSEGHLVQGIWYGADRQVKGSIIIGK